MKEVKPEQLSFQEEFAQFRKSVDERLMRLECAYSSRILGNEDRILGAVKRYLETTNGPISAHSAQNTQDTVDEIFNTIHRMNTTLSNKGDRQANHEAFSEPLSQGSKRFPEIDPVVLLSQLFELERLQFQRIEEGLEPPSTRAIRRWIRFEGRQEFGKLVQEVQGDVDCCSPTEDQLERFGLSLTEYLFHP